MDWLRKPYFLQIPNFKAAKIRKQFLHLFLPTEANFSTMHFLVLSKNIGYLATTSHGWRGLEKEKHEQGKIFVKV